jgi:hypothetical protein
MEERKIKPNGATVNFDGLRLDPTVLGWKGAAICQLRALSN